MSQTRIFLINDEYFQVTWLKIALCYPKQWNDLSCIEIHNLFSENRWCWSCFCILFWLNDWDCGHYVAEILCISTCYYLFLRPMTYTFWPSISWVNHCCHQYVVNDMFPLGNAPLSQLLISQWVKPAREIGIYHRECLWWEYQGILRPRVCLIIKTSFQE